MDKQHKHKRDSSKPANAYFGTFAFHHRDKQTPQNTKESKFSNRTPIAKTIIANNYNCKTYTINIVVYTNCWTWH
jgi:hypothetical protein